MVGPRATINKSTQGATNLNASVAQLPERDASNVGDAGESPAGSAIFAALAQPARGIPLRTGRLRVQILHAAPIKRRMQSVESERGAGNHSAV